ncbi:uncharacterized protein LOC124922278 [Impatiens glandulifera]|uniref:uncharacterized protein LOC124922278 n=1 Tax=Impatiens glandulifera TaxID=253017 RepID=UPI001FB0D5CF|nr:uncharacterized protein LOC124922278 [Impatiens glandulifera]
MAPKVAVFTDTNLGTHIAVQVSEDIRAADFKRELKKAHFNCFPKHGIINILSLMVKHKSFFYHLPDSLLLRDVFRHIKGSWYISVNARSCSNNPLSRKIKWMRFQTLKTKKKKKKKRITVEDDRIENCVVVSENESVSGIIKKYFSDYNDTESQNSDLRFKQHCKYRTPPPPRKVISSKEEEEGGFIGKGIGKRLLSASSDLRTQQKRKSFGSNSKVRNLVFEISDHEDD